MKGLRRPREEWIEIAVPALVSAEQFARAREQLEWNKRYAKRRTKEPTLLQGMLVCRECGHAYYRSSARTTRRKLYYYRCPGAEGWRYEEGRRCASRPLRQDRLDRLVWDGLVRLLEDPALLRGELERRLEASREAGPQQRQLEELRSERARLLTAYQEELISLDELRDRVPAILDRKRQLDGELQAVGTAAADRDQYLRVAETLESFRERLRAGAGKLDVVERQKVLRALVKEVLVGDGEITICHSIPLPGAGGSLQADSGSNSSQDCPSPQSYLYRGRRHRSHVQGTAGMVAPAADMAPAGALAAVAVKGGHADQGGGLARADRARPRACRRTGRRR